MDSPLRDMKSKKTSEECCGACDSRNTHDVGSINCSYCICHKEKWEIMFHKKFKGVLSIDDNDLDITDEVKEFIRDEKAASMREIVEIQKGLNDTYDDGVKDILDGVNEILDSHMVGTPDKCCGIAVRERLEKIKKEITFL